MKKLALTKTEHAALTTLVKLHVEDGNAGALMERLLQKLLNIADAKVPDSANELLTAASFVEALRDEQDPLNVISFNALEHARLLLETAAALETASC